MPDFPQQFRCFLEGWCSFAGSEARASGGFRFRGRPASWGVLYFAMSMVV
jgi:hypothetical protein